MNSNHSHVSIPFKGHILHEIEMQNFCFTLFYILQNMWTVAIGFIVIECVIYLITNQYTNLLVISKLLEQDAQSMILENGWKVLIFGIVLAIVTASLESVDFWDCVGHCDC